MRTNYLFNISAAFFVATFTTTLAQSSWETVDNLAKSRGRDIVADSQGNFISLAIDDSTNTSSPVTTAVSVSADHGATWQTVGSIAGYALDLAVAPDGALFATGNRSATVSGRAFLWQSLDHGATWTVSDPSAGLSAPILVTDVAAGNSGAIYVCGQSFGPWMVRKGQRTQSGITWATVDTPGLGQATSVFVRPGMAGQPDEVLVCGGGWTVRRSLDGGATWNTLDSSSGSAFALTTAPDGGIYVVGRIATTTTVTNQTVVKKKVVITTTTTTQYGWQVRKSANDGATWANMDYVANGWPQYSITADAFGRVFAVGFNDVTPRTWLVRGSSDGGATWATTDLFLPSGATSAQAVAVGSDAFGNVCVVGELYYGTTVSAPIRRLAAP
jgi:hypothetical protein